MGPVVKKMTLIIIGIFSTMGAYAQTLTLEDLMNEDASYARNSKKKWVTELGESKNYDSSVAILKSEFEKLVKSKNWSMDTEVAAGSKEMSFQTYKKMYRDRLITDLKSAGFELVNARINDQSRTLIYAKNNITIEVVSFTTETSAETIYLVSMLY